MANVLYPSGKRALLNKEINIQAESISAVLVSSSYNYSGAHLTISDISLHVISGASVELTGKQILNTANNAVFDADDPTFVSVGAGDTVKALALYHTTSGTLIAYMDVGSGIPFQTNGGDITINFSNGNSRVFAL